MLGKGVNCPHGWTLVDENIENVEHMRLDRETQRELGCLVGEHVFLEYPWAFVHRDTVAKFAKLPDSSLAPFREKIEIYELDFFLVGYSSVELTSDEFAICLTEEARRLVWQRNKNIARSILNNVTSKVIKDTNSWNSLGSDLELDVTFLKNTRQYFEIEIALPGRVLCFTRTLSDRNANDSRDSYMELVNVDEKFENIERKCICRSVQTHLQTREAFAQTYPSYPRNAWTQYVYGDTLNETYQVEDLEEEGEKLNEETSERNDDDRSQGKDTIQSKETEEEPAEKTPLELFLEDRSEEMIEVVKYNAAVNVYIDDIQNLSREDYEIRTITEAPTFHEQVSFITLNLTGNKAVSDVSLHKTLTEYAVVSYRAWKKEFVNEGEFQCRALIWKLNEPLRPQIALHDHREIYSISFSPYNLVIGGCSTGQVIIWNIKDYLSEDENTKFGARNDLPILRPIVVSDKDRSHRLPVRKIQWMPANCRIEPNGKLTKPSISSGVEFLTVSEDGTVAVWNLSPDDENFIELFQPVIRFTIRNGKPQNFNPLCLCLPSNKNSQDANKCSKEDYLKCLWIGCTEGLMKCSWEEQEFEESVEIIECNVSSCSHIHDGPVTDITRSPNLQNVLLTVGGQVFAVWDDTYMDSPLFWRRTSSAYTTCCWANEPGVFLLGSKDGTLEMWDIKNESNRPTFLQVVSSKSITCLVLLESSTFGQSKVIGVGDRHGSLRVFKEPDIFCNNTTIERMDWFEEYIWREVRRKKVFVGWQNDFLASDPLAIAKRLARRDEECKREAEKAREKLRREQETRLRLEAEKRARSAPIPKDVARKSREFKRMKEVLLSKKNLVPSELEAKRLPLVVLKAERKAKLEKVREKIVQRDIYFSNALSVVFPQLLEPNVEVSKLEEPKKLGKSIDNHVQRFIEFKRRANEELVKNTVNSYK